MHFELTRETALQALPWVLGAYLVASFPLVWGQLAAPVEGAPDDGAAPPETAPRPAPRSSEGERGGPRTFLVQVAAGLVALWFGAFLASLDKVRAAPARRPPPMTGNAPDPRLAARARAARRRLAPRAPRRPQLASLPGEARPRLAQAPPAMAPARPVPTAAPAAEAPPPTPRPAAAAPALPYDPQEPTRVDFQDVDIKVVLRFLAERTRTNYFMDPSIQAKITVIGPRAIPLQDAVVFLEAALEARGFTVIDSGTFKQVIPKAKASGAPLPLYTSPAPTDGSPLAQERTVTEILELDHAPVSEVKAALATLLPEGSSVLEHAPTNKLILTTTVRSLARLRRVIDELDVLVPGKTVHLLPVHHRSATELAKQVQEVLAKEELEKRVPKTKEHEATRPALLADPAHNTLVVVATAFDFARIRRLVAQVDRDPDPGPELEFLRLHHAEPAEVVKMVQAALKVEGVGNLPPYTMVPDERTQTIMIRTPSENLRAQIRGAVKRLDEEGKSLESARVRVYHLNFAEAAKVAELLGQIDFAGEAGASASPAAANAPAARELVKVVADENTNSLVITAPRGLFDAIDAVIRQLDVVKPQVMVEVLIAEVDYDWAKGVGLDFSFLNEVSSNTNRPFGIGNTGTLSEAAGGGGLPSGLNVGLIHGKDFDLGAALTGDAGELSKIALLLRLFEGTSHANILSSPTLFTSDNETARIAIGERIQLPASFATAANTGLNTVTSFNSEDLGVILEITPRITRDDHVVLAVDQSIKARTGDLLGSLETPVLSNREVTTSVSVRDGDTVVIGGLLSEEEQAQESRIPILSRLPGIGRLFRSTRRSTRKTNLMIFLTPHIVRDDAEARRIAARSRNEIAGEIERSRAHEHSVIREVFRPGRSLGRYRVEEPPELPFSTGDGDEGAGPAPRRAARVTDVDALVEEIRKRLDGGTSTRGTGG